MNNNYDRVYQYKIELKDVNPKIWRRIQVPESYTFWDLHAAIQDAMGWYDEHLHSFYITNPDTGEQEEISPATDMIIGKKIRDMSSWAINISQYFSLENRTALYLYDNDDNWQHSIELEKIVRRNSDIQYPLCLEGENACPPEECGGPEGYADLLREINEPDDEYYNELIQWVGEDFDPEYFNVDEVIFEDPDKHWEMLFGENEDEFEDWSGPIKFDEESKALSINFFKNIWERVKNNDMEGLSSEELKAAKLMKDHEEEFFNQFEFADVLSDYKYDREGDVDPFIHIFIHSIIEEQLETNNPPEVIIFYNSMVEKGCSHHEAVHSAGAILSLLLPPVLQNIGPFDLKKYKQLLNKYKSKRPEELFELLQQEDLYS